MKAFFLFILSLCISVTAIESVSAMTGVDTSSGETSFSQEAPVSLALKSIKVLDDKHIRIVFSETIEAGTVKTQIIKQSDNTSVRVESLTGAIAASDSVDVTLVAPLTEGSTYSITLLSAIGKSGATITDGALAIKDFITPIPLKKSVPTTLNAASNPSAAVSQNTLTKTSVTSPTVVSAEMPLVASNELPLTGMNPLFLLLLIFPFAYMLLRRRA